MAPPATMRNNEDSQQLGSRPNNALFAQVQSFAFEVSIIGARAIVDVRRTWFLKTMWTLLVLFGLGLAIFQIQDRVSFYFSYPTSASVNVQHNDELKFPQITICNENQIFRSAAEKYAPGLANVLQRMYPLIYIPGQPVTNLSFFNNWFWNDTIVNAMYEALAQPISRAIIICIYNGAVCNFIDATPRKLVTNAGQCFTFNYDGIDLTTTDVGNGYGLTMFLSVDQDEYLVPAGSFTSGFHVLIHDQKEVPWVKELGFKASSGSCTAAAITYSQTVQAKPPYGTCNDEDGYTESGCRMDCWTKYLVAKCGCRTNYMSGTAPICNIVQGYKCVQGVSTNYTSDPMGSVKCNCRPQCVTNVYDYTLSSAAFSNFALDYIKSVVFPNSTIQELNENMACLQVYFSTLSSVTISAEAAYSFMGMLSDVGGALGLFLGSTILTLVEIAEFGIRLTQEVCSRRRQRRQEKLKGNVSQQKVDLANDQRIKEALPNDIFKHRVLSVISLDDSITLQ